MTRPRGMGAGMVVAVSALVSAGLLASCSIPTVRNPSPTTSVALGIPTAPTPLPSVRTSQPVAMSQRFPYSEAGAEAFIRHLFDVLNDAFKTADDTELRRVVSETCSRCGTWADIVERNGRKHWRLDGDFAVVKDVELLDYGRGRALASVMLTSKKTPYRNSHGVKVDYTNGREGTLLVEVRFSDGWTVFGTLLG